MKIKTNYSSTEFKERQSSFEFFCEFIYELVLTMNKEGNAFLSKFRKESRAGWYKLFTKKIQPTEQLEFKFNAMSSLKEWATWTTSKNHELAF